MNLQELLSRKTYSYALPGIVLGSAPSVKFARKIQQNKIQIALGDLPWRAPKLGPFDFWVTANNIFPLPWNPKHAQIIKELNLPTLISCVALSNLHFMELHEEDKFLKRNGMLNLSNVIPYDSVHSSTSLSPIKNLNSCPFPPEFDVGPSIQNLILKLNKYSNSTYSTGHTVAIHGFALAILLQLNPIYLCGIEIPRSMNKYKYINNLKKLNYSDETIDQYCKRMIKNYIGGVGKKFGTDFSNDTFYKIIEDFTILTDLAKNLGIEVINLSANSSLANIKGITTIEKI